MKKKNRIIYPEHQCLSCERMHTNKNYCDIHQQLYTVGAKNPVPAQNNYITADRQINPLNRRLENQHKLR